MLSQKGKICNFDCIYCQLGKTKKYSQARKIYVPTRKLIQELKILPDIKIDYITFSGRGEPTLAKNLGEAIKEVKSIREENIAVITNGSLIGKEQVRKELKLANFVIIKLDACSQKSLIKINRPSKEIEFNNILNGIKEFKKGYTGKLALQIMFIEENKKSIDEHIYLSNYIKPDEVQVNTPLRRCRVKPLSKEEIYRIKNRFILAGKGINIVSVYDERLFKEVVSVSNENTLKRRGKIK
ncbi:MAG: radical SAM protein [Candidatus Omnitrophica bacterium]|nr:radical SAM protein [Candidatus Omnitrophota bacterium]